MYINESRSKANVKLFAQVLNRFAIPPILNKCEKYVRILRIKINLSKKRNRIKQNTMHYLRIFT